MTRAICRRGSGLFGLLLITLLLAGCGSTVGETIDDATISTRVKTAILNDPQIGGRSINVDTSAGVVTLTGEVRTGGEEQRAVSLARDIPGVREVKSALKVVPEG
jgi:hyperosmotically inducible periplasmic protein